jgi:hypothetical protein
MAHYLRYGEPHIFVKHTIQYASHVYTLTEACHGFR